MLLQSWSPSLSSFSYQSETVKLSFITMLGTPPELVYQLSSLMIDAVLGSLPESVRDGQNSQHKGFHSRQVQHSSDDLSNCLPKGFMIFFLEVYSINVT